MEQWIPIERPGPFGSKRDERFAEWDEIYGKGNWKIVYKAGNTYLSFLEACKLYEDSYYEFMRDNHGITNLLISEACNVYDDEETNVNSGFDYCKQETERTHIQDIAIRNALKRLGLWFKGKKLIRIRHAQGNHPLSLLLSPGAVYFHDLGVMEPRIKTEKKPWYMEGSVEDWYQRAKYLMVKK